MAASGHCHLLFYNKLMPWDHAAGWLLHREAGGYSAHFDGSPYKPVNLTGGLLCAPDEESWHAAQQASLTRPDRGLTCACVSPYSLSSLRKQGPITTGLHC
ncbi:inositol monophosphatase family protein [Bradyrhizobium septentrionale]|uniref:inositol monophosphatase family protein n=1 Tax=Bradyrhizobium septentrionale TaxID=1404411 RepID=UPI0030D231C1